ncbi:tetratricopeptide repeat protein [Paracoccus sp. (in: a-proteobacteria)]|uniref:tetratricopeptide repeat protein n=1 Tax=Paracoccus sp. TaxID=267 RepID=UPI0028999BD1|nr:tetratricopeptide repeat protein [Paracoccus sp. (in: a-proteobacteria)]
MTSPSNTGYHPTSTDPASSALALGQLMLDTGQPLAAIESFEAAAQGGNAAAMNMLGRIHERGWGIPSDAVKAAAYYRMASDAGEAWASINLADLYLQGIGVEQSDAEAHRLYCAAAETGHPKALNMLGMMAEGGRGPETSDVAQDYFIRAAEGGECWGQFNAARLLIAADRIEEGLGWIDRSLADGPPEYLRTIVTALGGHGDDRINKRAIWAETLLKRHFDETE